jgi:hypothetical protein
MAKIRNEAATDRDGAVREAIEYAEKHAGQNDADFVRALNLRFHETAQKSRARGVIPIRSADAPVKSFQIYQDSRYLKNARELARRTMGGLRVLGGAPVKAGDLLDCVAVGSDTQWGCTGTLVAYKVA